MVSGFCEAQVSRVSHSAQKSRECETKVRKNRTEIVELLTVTHTKGLVTASVTISNFSRMHNGDIFDYLRVIRAMQSRSLNRIAKQFRTRSVSCILDASTLERAAYAATHRRPG